MVYNGFVLVIFCVEIVGILELIDCLCKVLFEEIDFVFVFG